MMGIAFFVLNEMIAQLTVQYERRVASLVAIIDEDLAQESELLAGSLDALERALTTDDRFRRAAVAFAPEEYYYLFNYAGNIMPLTGLSLLQIQDETGRIISSGHFRHEYGRTDPELPKLLASTAEGMALVLVHAPDSPFLALARAGSFPLDGRRFTIIAGVQVGSSYLARLIRDTDVRVSLIYPGGTLSLGKQAPEGGQERAPGSEEGGEIVRELRIPFIGSTREEIAPAQIRVSHSLGELETLRRTINRWFLLAVGVASLLAIALATWLASRISRPLAELAEKTSHLDLDRLDIDFETPRKDEIGALSRLLGLLTEKLRGSTLRIKEAEHRATLGELARHVNHDIKNGLIPIRNVFRHLAELAREDPGRLPEVFKERQGTIESSITYLANLASNYARLYPRNERRPCDVNAIVLQVVREMRGGSRADFRVSLCDKAFVPGDPVALRRILENLVDNAIDSLESRQGMVSVTTEAADGEEARPRVRITIADTGIGMSDEQLAKAFDDFYTTKRDGAGLGLSIVRQLVMDLEGSVQVKSEQGKGSSFIIDLPRADDAARAEGAKVSREGGE
jgi:signal transduction histidine kinase